MKAKLWRYWAADRPIRPLVSRGCAMEWSEEAPLADPAALRRVRKQARKQARRAQRRMARCR